MYYVTPPTGSESTFSVAPEEKEITPGTTCLFTAQFKPVCLHLYSLYFSWIVVLNSFLYRDILANYILKNWNAMSSTKYVTLYYATINVLYMYSTCKKTSTKLPYYHSTTLFYYPTSLLYYPILPYFTTLLPYFTTLLPYFTTLLPYFTTYFPTLLPYFPTLLPYLPTLLPYYPTLLPYPTLPHYHTTVPCYPINHPTTLLPILPCYPAT